VKELFAHTTDRFSLVVKVTDDRLKAFVAAQAKEAGPVTRDELVTILKQHLSADLIHLAVVDDIAHLISAGKAVEERRVAKGIEPEDGMDARLVYLVKRFAPKKPQGNQSTPPPQENEIAFLSLRELHLFDNVRAGTVVARLYAAKAGKPGTDVQGKPLAPRTGQPLKLQLDKSLSQRTEAEGAVAFDAITSQLDGYLVEEQGKLFIKDELAISGNIDYHVGNLDFIGQLTIKGDVLPGFKVSAVKGVTILGSVQGGSVSSSKGNVSVKGFVFGGDTGRIICAGDFQCSTARQAHVEALGNITVLKEAYDCTLRSQKSVLAEAGRIIGGRTFAVCGAQAQQLGNEAGYSTLIDLCSDVEMTTEYASLVIAIDSHRQTKKLLELHLGPYATNQSRLKLLPPDYRMKLEKLLTKKAQVEGSLVALLAKQASALGNSHSNADLRVNYTKWLHQGVTIHAGGESHEVKEPLTGPGSIEFLAAEKKFVVGELKALTCAPREAANTATPAEKNISEKRNSNKGPL
jgi:uncharacterized protein (DUF342 family)